MYPENMIINNLEVLTEHFIPSRIVHRDGQLKVIRDGLKPIISKQKPRNIFIYGPPGTGKTCISRYVVEELNKEHSIFHPYVNCWEASSGFRILYNILHQLGAQFIHRKGIPTDELIDVLKKKLEEKFCVVILDEVDKLEDDKILYDILQLQKTGLILIANTEHAFQKTDPRIRSRLASSENIEFPAYKTQEILDILKDRRRWGLVLGAIKNTQLERIAESSQGDARFAINTLRIVAENAENNDMERIPDSYIENALKNPTKRMKTENLNPYQSLLLEIIKSQQRISSPELYREFQKRLQEKNLEKIAERTFRKYLEEMCRYGIIDFSGTSRWREYSAK